MAKIDETICDKYNHVYPELKVNLEQCKLSRTPHQGGDW